MINEKVQAKLNEQIVAELASSQVYLAMASWSDEKGWKGVASFFYEQSEEERMHALKIIHFINDRGGHATIPAVEKPKAEFTNLQKLFEFFLESELSVTKKISDVVDLCRQEKDYVTDQFMDWYLTEQLEEETLARDLLDELNIIGDDKGGLYSFDQKLKNQENKYKRPKLFNFGLFFAVFLEG